MFKEREWVSRGSSAGSEGVSSYSCFKRKERIVFSSIQIKWNAVVAWNKRWNERTNGRMYGGDGESYAYGIEAHCIRCHSNKLPKKILQCIWCIRVTLYAICTKSGWDHETVDRVVGGVRKAYNAPLPSNELNKFCVWFMKKCFIYFIRFIPDFFLEILLWWLASNHLK